MARGATTTAVARPGTARLATGNAIKIETVAELMQLAELLFRGGANSMPNVDRPEKVARIILAGMEVGLSPAQSLESIWIGKNGKTSIWGDGALGIVRASGLLEEFAEWVDGDGEDKTGHCKAKRAGGQEMHSTFSVREANAAGLIERARGKLGDGPWITYQDRMLKIRARGFLLRDLFTDVMKGLVTTEELQDYPAEAIEVKVVRATADLTPAASHPASLPPAAGVTTQVLPARPEPEPITPEQLHQMAQIRAGLIAARGLKDVAEQKASWTELLASYNVQSAKEFTAVQAAAFIAAEGPKNDPFGHPALPPASTA